MDSISVPQDVYWQIANYESTTILQPKIVELHRKENQGFGFTLRHFIAYPPEEWTYTAGTSSATAGLSTGRTQAMETVFIKEIHPNGPAHLAGLKVGDRLLMVNNIKIAGIPYSTIVSLIKQSQSVLRLQVVPKECDVLQMYYTDIAHNPETNRQLLSPSTTQKPKVCTLMRTNINPTTFHQLIDKKPLGVESRDMTQLALPQRYQNYSNDPGEKMLASIRNNQITYSYPESAYRLSDTNNQLDFMTRSLRKSIEQKEEFLKSPPSQNSILQRELYARPSRFVYPAWPPQHSLQQQSPPQSQMQALSRDDKSYAPTSISDVAIQMPISTNTHNITNNILPTTLGPKRQLPAKFIPIENQENSFYLNDTRKKSSENKFDSCARDRFNGVLRMQQTSPEMKMAGKVHEMKQTEGLNVVSELTKQFECGRPLSPDNTCVDKTLLYKSELSRIKTKLAVPIVTMRKKEIEMKMEKSSGDQVEAAPPNRRQLYNYDSKDLMEYGKMDQRPVVAILRDRPQQVLREPKIAERTSYKNYDTYESCDEIRTPIAMTAANFVRRYKPIVVDDDNKPMRRISYLKATGNETDCNFGLPATSSSPPMTSPYQKQEITTSIKDLPQSPKTPFIELPIVVGIPNNEAQSPTLEAEMNMKSTFLRGKKSQHRSWRTAKLELIGNILKVDCRDKKSEIGFPDALAGIDVRNFHVTEGEATKRKYVFQLTSKPQKTEGTQVLFQARNEVEYKKWMSLLHDISYGNSSTGTVEGGGSSGSTPASDSITKHGTQAAEPQKVAASTSVQTTVYCGDEPIQRYSSSGSSVAKSSTDADTSFNSSPMLKPRKSSAQKEAVIIADKEMGSPKAKNWKDLLFRKMHPHSSEIAVPFSPLPPIGSIGIPLKQCPMSKENEFVPYLVDLCTRIVESKGLNVVGIYRIPGNKAAISELHDQVNKTDISHEDAVISDPKWDDVNVVSSLLKLFIRSLPDALLPSHFYNKFIDADKKVGDKRLFEIKDLLDALPDHSYETLKHIIRHLHRVSKNCSVNLMEPKNLAIIFGPSIVRTPTDTLAIAVKDMKHQCRIVELIVSQYEYFFENGPLPKLPESPASATPILTQEDQTSLLLDNVSKIEHRHDKVSMSSRFIPHLRRRAHTKRSASTSMTSDTYSGDSVLSYDLKKNSEQRSTGSFEFRDKSERDSVDAASVLTDDESNQSRISDTGSMSLTTVTDTLDTKLRNLRTLSSATDQSDGSEKQTSSSRHSTYSQPLTLGDDIPYADESPERVLLPTKSVHLKNLPRITQSTYSNTPSATVPPSTTPTVVGNVTTPTSGNYLRDPKVTNTTTTSGNARGAYFREWFSDDSEVSTTSDPKESLAMSPLFMEKCRKRRGHKLFRSASFNCRNYSGRTINNHSTLTKDEKTDMNITKKRQIQNKQNRSIKRRHTVGGPHDYSTNINRRSNDDYNAILE